MMTFLQATKQLSRASTKPSFAPLTTAISSALDKIASFAIKASKDEALLETHAREFAFSMARTYICALLISHAGPFRPLSVNQLTVFLTFLLPAVSNLEADFFAAERFVLDGLYKVTASSQGDEVRRRADRLLAMDVDESTGKTRGVGDAAHGRLRAKY